MLSIGLISAILVARALGPEGRGLLAAVLIYPQLLVAITEGGMRQSAVLFLGKKKAPDSEIIGSLFSYIFIAGVVGMGVVYSLMLWFGQQQFDYIMMLVAAAILPTTLAVNALKGIFLGKEKIKNYNQATWVQKVLYVSAISLLFLLDLLTVFNAVLVTLLAAVFNLIQSIWYLKKNFDFKVRFSFVTFIQMLKKGVVYAIALFFIQANYKIDILILSWLSTKESLGHYAVSVQLGELLWQLPAAVLVVLMSKTANASDSKIIDSVCKSTRLTFLLTFLSGFALALISYFLIPFMFGNEFSDAYFLLIGLLPGIIMASIFKSLNAYFAGRGEPRVTIVIMGLAASINICLNLLLIPSLGALGAAIASSLSYSFAAIGSLTTFIRREGVHISKIIIVESSDFAPLIKKFKGLKSN